MSSPTCRPRNSQYSSVPICHAPESQTLMDRAPLPVHGVQVHRWPLLQVPLVSGRYARTPMHPSPDPTADVHGTVLARPHSRSVCFHSATAPKVYTEHRRSLSRQCPTQNRCGTTTGAVRQRRRLRPQPPQGPPIWRPPHSSHLWNAWRPAAALVADAAMASSAIESPVVRHRTLIHPSTARRLATAATAAATVAAMTSP